MRPYIGAGVQFRYAGKWLAAVITKVHGEVSRSPRDEGLWRDPVDLQIFLEAGGLRPQRMVERATANTDHEEGGFWRWPPELVEERGRIDRELLSLHDQVRGLLVRALRSEDV